MNKINIREFTADNAKLQSFASPGPKDRVDSVCDYIVKYIADSLAKKWPRTRKRRTR